ncbi:alpha-amylase family glycosyl hydrolase [Thermospira aquatica]|uniref:Glycosyl hydrolase family 13 catalytic domain-containing protein n=1 Tax=Thermospira aquatica TaxID=2828656 RepID=A0AAX3BFG6_9SPIR|nr:alpha-amylase family glycosyl hydrolase [Thermospira aquatica]URA10809.1 hypothetical protein KDW03_03110 [Thermospira aquatica]
MEIFGVWRIDSHTIDVNAHEEWPVLVALRDVENGETFLITRKKRLRKDTWRLFTPFLRDDHNYELIVHNRVFPLGFSEAYWNRFRFRGWLGVRRTSHTTIFRLFAPRAQKVILSLFEKPYQNLEPALYYEGEIQLEMRRIGHGVWEISVPRDCKGYYYGYRVFGPKGPGELFRPDIIIADPYAHAVASFVVYPQRHLAFIVDDNYKWKNPRIQLPKNHEWLIYECHLRDMTMLSSCEKKGTYDGFVERNQEGGIAHLKELGVNAVEFLPLQEFAEIEPYYLDHSTAPFYNDFNPYSRNHWGYMTTSFFSPENYYARGDLHQGAWNGSDGYQVYAMKNMVDKLHGEGIAVIMDVVYNHVSLYDANALRLIDRHYYFWTTSMGHDEARTGCGNDFRSDRFMSRRLVIDSLIHWVKEYNIDGFRFDLATVIDWETYRQLARKLRRLKPDIFLTVEPWHGGRGGKRDGGDYCLHPGQNHFSRMGITAWNDRFRNLIRGGTHAHPYPSYGLVFGKISTDEIWQALQCYPGIFLEPYHSVNYIESHDNHTFTDFLRIGSGDIRPDQEIKPEEILDKAVLTPRQLDQAKLAALVLFLSPGVVMIHEGQEFGRMRLVHPPDGSFSLLGHVHWHKNMTGEWVNHHQRWPKHKAHPWTIDGDGYEKDNPTNWVDWRLKEINRPLYDFYRSLIAFRKAHSWIGKIRPPHLTKKLPEAGEGFGWEMSHKKESLVVLINFSSAKTVFHLSPSWELVFSTHLEETYREGQKIVLPSTRGIVLKKK